MKLLPALTTLALAMGITLAAEATSEIFINVQDHGAVGDGIHDDAAAVQQAIDKVGKTGGTVFFPVGKYRIGKTLTIPGGKPVPESELNWVTLRGAGGTGSQLLGDKVDYILSAVGPEATYNYANGIRIYELTFSSFDRKARCSGINASAMLRVFIDNCNFVALERGIHSFHEKRSDSIWILRIANNLFSMNMNWSIDIQRAFDVVIDNNIIEHGRGGIKVGTPGDTADAACNTIRIENNVIEGMSSATKNPAILGASWIGARIVGNYFEGNASGDIAIIPQDGDGWTRGLTISSNTFSPTKAQRETNDYGPIFLRRAFDVEVSNNFTTGERLLHGSSSNLVRNVLVYGNSLNNPSSVSFAGLTPAERAEYEKKTISHKLSRNRFVIGGRITAGVDSDRGLVVGNNALSYADESPANGNSAAATGDVVFNRKPQKEGASVVIGWYCIESGTPGKWLPMTVAVK